MNKNVKENLIFGDFSLSIQINFVNSPYLD